MLDLTSLPATCTDDPSKKYIYTGRERHSSSRHLNWGYPTRTIRDQEYLFVWNMKPERWPAGAPQRIVRGTTDDLWPMYGIDEDGVHHSDWAFTDIDAAPTKSYIVENREDESIKPDGLVYILRCHIHEAYI